MIISCKAKFNAVVITSTNQGQEQRPREEGGSAEGHGAFFTWGLQIWFPFRRGLREGRGGFNLAASFRDPVEYNIKPQGGEKTCSALK